MFSANKRLLWYLQTPASLKRSSIVLTSYLFSLLLIERGPRCSSTLLGKKNTPAPPHWIPVSTTSSLFFFFLPRPLCRKMAPASPHGKGHRCRQEAHLLWEEEGPDINRKRCAAELLLPPSEGGLENNVSLRCRTRRQETHARWCLPCRGNDKHYLAWLGAEIAPSKNNKKIKKKGGGEGGNIVFLHTGSEPVLCQMENKIKSKIWNVSGIRWGTWKLRSKIAKWLD